MAGAGGAMRATGVACDSHPVSTGEGEQGAGTGARNWSILRTRIMAIIKRDHHATRNWTFSDLVQQKYPWNSLAIDWAYSTGKRFTYEGEPLAESVMAAGWLLACYNSSYGESPPRNQKI